MSVQEVIPILWGVGTNRTLRAHWVMHELGLDYKCEPIRPRSQDMDRPDFLAVNPDCKVPVLQHGNLTLVESSAIMIFLAETYAENAPYLIPHDRIKRARFFEWLSFLSTELDAASLYTIRRHQELPQLYGHAPVAVEAAREYFLRMAQKAVREIEHGGPYILGQNFTLADILLASCLIFAERMGVERLPSFDEYFHQVKGRPAFRAATKANDP